MGTLYRGAKSFRVIGTKALDPNNPKRALPTGSFAYVKYNHASDMWKTEIWGNDVVKRAKDQLTQNGSNPSDAAEITRILNWVGNILTKAARISTNDPGATKLTPDEAEIVRQVGLVRWIGKEPGEDHLAKSLLDYVSYGQYQGISFENRFDELMRSLFKGGENMSFAEGKSLNDIRADEQVDVKSQLGGQVFTKMVELINTDHNVNKYKAGEGMFSLSGAQYQKLRTAMRLGILEAANLDLNKLFNNTSGIEVLFNRSRHGIDQIIITKVRKEQKIDINVNGQYSLEIRDDICPELKTLAEKVRGKTFTLTNYQIDTYKKGGFSLGNTQDGRMLSALFTYATGNTTYSDVATFIYATRESELHRNDPTLARYRSWGATIYELLGIGTRADGRIPDYFVGNVYTPDDFGSGKVIVRSTLDFLAGAPYGTNPLVFGSGSSIRV